MMKYYADLHIHSRFSRATSKQLNLEELAMWAQMKGIQVVGTGDCLHPAWFKELEQQLDPAEPGLFQLKKEHRARVARRVPKACQADVRFMLSTEIANIYKKADKVRKVHNVVFVPDFHAAKAVYQRLDRIGNLKSDGRPILGLDSRHLLEIVLESALQNLCALPAWVSILVFVEIVLES